MKKRKDKRTSRDGFSMRVKVWIEDRNGDMVMSMGRVAMLEAIERTGSLNRAAQEMNMSYRAIWLRLRSTEDRLGKKLMVSTTGGSEGGGTELTPLARAMIIKFRELNSDIAEAADSRFIAYSEEFLEDDDTEPPLE